MKIYYLSSILAFILAISLVHSNEVDMKTLMEKCDEANQLFCSKEVTDDQLAEMNKCKDVHTDQGCLNATELTDRQRFDTFCNKDHKDCMMQGWTDHFSKAKPEEIEEHMKSFETKKACVKKALQIE